jgi:hypothetical protein
MRTVVAERDIGGNLDLSALTLAASLPPEAASTESATKAFEATGARSQQQLGLPVLESFGGRPSYKSRPPAGRPHYQPPTKSGGERPDHEDIKVIHFGVV